MANCSECNGTGRDDAKTRAMYARESSSTEYVRCWNCNGNGLEPPYPNEYAQPGMPPGYADGYEAGKADWVAARYSEYASACATESATSYSGQYGRGYIAGYRWARANYKQL